MSKFDIVVIGSGPGGYVAAVDAAQKGKRVAVVERGAIGGACLNVGCIPSKSYLKHTHWVFSFQEAEEFGMIESKSTINFSKLVDRKNDVVQQIQAGIHYLFKTNGVTYLQGEARFNAQKELYVNNEKIEFENVLLATGGHPFIPPIPGVDKVDYLTTNDFFEMRTLPKKLVIIGGGVIAVELAYTMKPLGVDVSMIEVAPDIILNESSSVREFLRKKLTSLGISYVTNAKIKNVSSSAVELEGGVLEPFDKLLVATGRKANLELAEQLGLALDERKRFIKVNEKYQTSQANIYAVGDVIGGYQLAHVATEEGLRAVSAMLGQVKGTVKFDEVPRCIYTTPEIASFGMSEDQALENQKLLVSTAVFSTNGKAIAAREVEGFVKLIGDKKYHELLGAIIVGEHATEAIHTLLAVKESEGRIDELAHTIFSHPTLSETIGESAREFLKQAKK